MEVYIKKLGGDLLNNDLEMREELDGSNESNDVNSSSIDNLTNFIEIDKETSKIWVYVLVGMLWAIIIFVLWMVFN